MSLDNFIVGILAMINIGAIFFPIIYAIKVNCANKPLYFSAIVGYLSIIYGLLYIACGPINFALLKVVPQLAENGHINNILPLLYLSDWVSEWYLLITLPMLIVFLSIKLRSRHTVFHVTKIATGKTTTPSAP